MAWLTWFMLLPLGQTPEPAPLHQWRLTGEQIEGSTVRPTAGALAGTIVGPVRFAPDRPRALKFDGNSKAKNWGWRMMRRNPGVYVRCRGHHADHATITLHEWHQVVMNTESKSKAMRNVAFLD